MATVTPTTPTGIALVTSDATLRAFLDEDLGSPWRDVTSDPIFAVGQTGAAHLVTRSEGVASGLDEAARIFALCDCALQLNATDGAAVAAGTVLARADGAARDLLRAERTALNVVGRMSGIATYTRRVQRALDATGARCQVAATRKTTPGFRTLEKRAVIHGGGDPHRYGLYDQMLIKDNHRAAFGDLSQLIARLRAAHPGLILEVEVESLAQAKEAAEAGADWLLLDNMDPAACAVVASAMRAAFPKLRLEASGGITLANAAAYAPHVDRVSMGALTQAAPALDVALDWLESD